MLYIHACDVRVIGIILKEEEAVFSIYIGHQYVHFEVKLILLKNVFLTLHLHTINIINDS